jgi:hypothetical protein
MMTLPVLRRSCMGALVVAILAGCDGDPAAIPSALLEISVSTAGAAFDPDGYVILRDGTEIYRRSRLIDFVRLSGHPGQSIELELTDVAANCRVDGGAHRTVTFVDGSMPRESFEIECAAPPGLESARLVFVTGPCTAYVTEGCDLHTLPMDGGEGRRLTDDGRSAQPAISADGSTIAFTRLDPGSGYPVTDVFAMDVDGASPRRITDEGNASDPSWSPDGTRVVYMVGDGYWTGQIRVRRLDEEASLSVPTPGLDWAPVWSPDGTRIAFSRWTDSEIGIYTMAPDGSDVVEVAAGGMGPVWSPASDRIAYQIDGSPFVIDLTAGTRTRLMSGSPDGGWRPTGWSPDGEWIALDQSSGWGWEGSDIFLLRIDDGMLVRVTLDGQSSSAVFVPGG